MATTVEALLGAVFLDRGENAMQAVMTRLGLDHPLLHLVKSICCCVPIEILLVRT